IGIGYATGAFAQVKRVCAAVPCSPEGLVRWSLASVRQDGGRSAFSRDRITCPMHDTAGREMAFSARALGDARPKYGKTRETPIFHRGAALFGLDGARRYLAKGGELFAVEGNLDAIALQRVDKAGVAPLGTALTPDQLLAMWKLV